MSVRSALAAGRRRADITFIDRCHIEHPTGQRILDPVTDTYIEQRTPVYGSLDPHDGRCRLKRPSTTGVQAEAGEQSIATRDYELHIPWDAPTPVAVNDIVVIDQSDDAWVIGRELTVASVGYSGSTTARRLILEDRS